MKISTLVSKEKPGEHGIDEWVLFDESKLGCFGCLTGFSGRHDGTGNIDILMQVVFERRIQENEFPVVIVYGK